MAVDVFIVYASYPLSNVNFPYLLLPTLLLYLLCTTSMPPLAIFPVRDKRVVEVNGKNLSGTGIVPFLFTFGAQLPCVLIILPGFCNRCEDLPHIGLFKSIQLYTIPSTQN